MIYEIRGLSFAYSTSKEAVLRDLNLDVDAGEIVSILGHNGSGKSTLLSCMLGLLVPQSGTILLDGRDISQLSEREIASTVGFVPQIHIPTFGFSVLDFVVMGCAQSIGLFSKPGKEERENARAALYQMGIGDLAEKRYTEISGGERQKTMIARAIVSKPEVLLFDEPTAHLDFGGQLLVLRTIRDLAREGYSVVITTHNPDHALLLGGKAALMNGDGGLISGDVAAVITRENLSRIYKSEVRLEYIESLGRTVCLYADL